jgi:hypothetical protein
MRRRRPARARRVPAIPRCCKSVQGGAGSLQVARRRSSRTSAAKSARHPPAARDSNPPAARESPRGRAPRAPRRQDAHRREPPEPWYDRRHVVIERADGKRDSRRKSAPRRRVLVRPATRGNRAQRHGDSRCVYAKFFQCLGPTAPAREIVKRKKHSRRNAAVLASPARSPASGNVKESESVMMRRGCDHPSGA